MLVAALLAAELLGNVHKHTRISDQSLGMSAGVDRVPNLM